MMSQIGPSRHIASARDLGRFRGVADIKWQAGLGCLVANDPFRSFARAVAGYKRCQAREARTPWVLPVYSFSDKIGIENKTRRTQS
jgi:hypothetical protein